jgi:outer membrane protein assembly factor BamB
MQTNTELNRRPSPATRPHPLTYRDGLLWMASWDTNRVYAIDPQTWNVLVEVEAPGQPYGITAYGDGLMVVVALGDDDDRYLFRLSSGGVFDLDSKRACPDFTGSYLAAAGETLYLGQMTLRRILALAPDGGFEREIPLPTRCAGLGFGANQQFYIIAGDSELEHLQFGRLDIRQDAPQFEAIRPLPDEARSLAYDGTQWWTCLRDDNEIASFTA